MMAGLSDRVINIIVIILIAVSAMGFMPQSMSCGAVDSSTLTALDTYPGIKAFDFSVSPVRENVPDSIKVDPDYSIQLSKLVPDEYFGASVSQMRDSVSGQNVNGIILGLDGVKGGCGCIYRRMFQYRNNWIDVKTTYMDWSVILSKSSFMAGGFARQRWKSLWWVEMKHEFFISGTDTPVNVKGFLEYDDVDNSQGLYLDMNETDDLWVNSGGTSLGYKNVPGGVQYAQNSRTSYVVDRDMLCIQSMTNNDIPTREETGYSASDAARACFAFTFSGNTLHTCLIDDDTQGFNVLDISDTKNIPSAPPEEDTDLISKRVSDDDESGLTSNSVRSVEGWTYCINAMAPPETEPGNFYDSFRIEDQIDGDLNITDVRIRRGADEDASDLFEISTTGNLVRAEALDTQDADFYGYEYYLYIDVAIGSTKEELMQEGRLNEDLCCIFLNTATAVYEDGGGETAADTNETDTEAVFEAEIEADIVIRKEIRAADNYSYHGNPVFMFRLQGTTRSGDSITLNGCIAILPGDDEGTCTFSNVPEGQYTCTEYETLRFRPERITDVSGGRVSGSEVVFTVDSTDTRRATFVNSKVNWSDYSDSNVVVNRIGIN